MTDNCPVCGQVMVLHGMAGPDKVWQCPFCSTILTDSLLATARATLARARAAAYRAGLEAAAKECDAEAKAWTQFYDRRALMLNAAARIRALPVPPEQGGA